MSKIYPTILTDSLDTAQQQIDLIMPFQEIKILQFDIIDGQFAENFTLSLNSLLDLNFGRFKIDLHLMSLEPIELVQDLELLPKDLPIRAILAQVEKMSQQNEYCLQVKQAGYKVGLVLDIFTPLDSIDDEIWPNLQFVQLMGVEAGEQNQEFKILCLKKLEKLKAKKEKLKLNFEIIVDGGIKVANAAQILKSGADGLAVGSVLWQSQNLSQEVSTLDSFFKIDKL